MGAGPTCCIHRASRSGTCIHRACRGAGHHVLACTILSVSEQRCSVANDKEASCTQRSHCPPPAIFCSTRRSPPPRVCTAHLDGSTIGASLLCWLPTCAMGGTWVTTRASRSCRGQMPVGSPRCCRKKRATIDRTTRHGSSPPTCRLPHRRAHPRGIRHSRATARRTRQHRHRTRSRICDHRSHRISHRRGAVSELPALADTRLGPWPRR